jgi:hypothetical protein
MQIATTEENPKPQTLDKNADCNQGLKKISRDKMKIFQSREGAGYRTNLTVSN